MTTAALILAGGRGTRLVPLAAPFMKPLYRVGDRPLVGHALDFAIAFGVGSIIAVTNPTNDRAILAELPADADRRTVVQREPTGVVDAIRIGLEPVTTDRVLLLCSDNTFEPDGTWFYEATRDWGAAIAVRELTDPTGRYSTVIRGTVYPRRPDERAALRWVGPVLLPALGLRAAVDVSNDVETVLNVASMSDLKMIPMSCADHGVAL